MKLRIRVPVTSSNFAMWRAAIALAYGDNYLSNSEINLIHEYWEYYDFSEEQQRQLEADIKNGVKLDDVWDQITDKLDRAQLINFAMVLFYIDGEYSDAEKALWEEINNRHMPTIDFRGAMKEARGSSIKYLAEDKAALDADYKKESRLLKGFHYITFYDERHDEYVFPNKLK